MARLRRKSLIKRYPLPLVKRTLVANTVDENNPFVNSTSSYTFDRSSAEACTVQPTSGYEISTMPEGNKSKELYTIYTNTPLHPSIEATNSLADSVYIPDSLFGFTGGGGWFTVIKAKPRINGVVNHFEIICAKDYNTLSTENIEQYPSTTTLSPLIDTKVKLVAGEWITTWEGENV